MKRVILASLVSIIAALVSAYVTSKLLNIHGWVAGFIVGTVHQACWWSMQPRRRTGE